MSNGFQQFDFMQLGHAGVVTPMAGPGSFFSTTNVSANTMKVGRFWLPFGLTFTAADIVVTTAAGANDQISINIYDGITGTRLHTTGLISGASGLTKRTGGAAAGLNTSVASGAVPLTAALAGTLKRCYPYYIGVAAAAQTGSGNMASIAFGAGGCAALHGEEYPERLGGSVAAAGGTGPATLPTLVANTGASCPAVHLR